MPASFVKAAMYNAVNGVCSAGFKTVTHPVANTGAILKTVINAG